MFLNFGINSTMLRRYFVQMAIIGNGGQVLFVAFIIEKKVVLCYNIINVHNIKKLEGT